MICETQLVDDSRISPRRAEGRDHHRRLSGIGAGLTSAYRERGYAVVATARAIGTSRDPGIVTVAGDIADPDTAERVVAEAVQRFGRIDTLINNAGLYIGKPFTDYTLEDFNALISVNLAGFFHITTRTIGRMADQRSGHVVNVSTALVEQADSGRPAALTVLTKGGLVAVTRSLAIEYASRGLRVNAVSLGSSGRQSTTKAPTPVWARCTHSVVWERWGTWWVECSIWSRRGS